MRIETERLILREFNINDVPDVFEYASNELVGPAAGWKPHESVDESQGIVEDFIKSGTIAVTLKDTSKVIGSIGFHDTSVSKLMKCLKGLELGYILGADFWGRGYMTEAVRAAVEHRFSESGLDIIWCGYFDGNERSRRVQDKLGFRECYTKTTECAALGKTFFEHISFLTREIYFSHKGDK